MKNTVKFYLPMVVTCLLLLSSCEKEDPIIPNEEEVITSLIYTLTSLDGSDIQIFSFEDADGDGGNDPVITNAVLKTNTTYNASISLLNKLENPAGDIGEEVLEEAEEHQLFFSTEITGLDITYADSDADNNPLGLSTQVTTAAADSGVLTITLRHEPNKSAAGVANGDITNAGGETDIEVSFNVTIQ